MNIQIYVDVAVNRFVKNLDFAAKRQLNLVKTKKKEKRICQPWQDSDCHALKKKLKHISNQKHKEPYNEITRLNYHRMNKEYKHLNVKTEKAKTSEPQNGRTC